MKKLLLAILMLAASLPLAAQTSKPAAAESESMTVIRAGRLIDPASGEVRQNQVIVIRGDRIESVGGALTAKVAPGTKVIDLSRATVLPGLIDTHTHIFLQGELPEEGGYDIQLLKFYPAYRAARAVVAARRAVEQGFTTIRDVETEGAGYGDVGIKRAIDESRIPGPRIFTSGRALSVTGGYPLEGYAPNVKVPKGVEIEDGPTAFRKAVREQLDFGVDWIKVYMTHRSWLDKDGKLQSQPTLTLEEIKAVTDEAHANGHRVACHAYNGLGMQRALDGGCDSIEHGLELTDANIAQMLKQGTWYVPTLSVYYDHWAAANTEEGKRDRARAAVHGPSFRKALEAGVKMAYGTDMGGIAWSESMAQEFAREVEFGMTPMQAIQSATVRAAELLEQQGQMGVIAPGAYADIVALTGDPLQDVNQLEHIGFVMKGGEVVVNSLTAK
jgi:imidazolonepropionase-like amidohydrolase